MSRFEAILKALKNWGKKNDDQTAADAEAGSEALNSLLPEQVSGRRAIVEQREKLSTLDKMLEEANR
jgi:hypothetical protein